MLNSIHTHHPSSIAKPISIANRCLNPLDGNNSLPTPHDNIPLTILVSLPPTYPASSPPQLQLLSRYIGPFGVDSALFGSILRTFISSLNGIEWTPDTVCVFDGIQTILERCVAWYEEKLTKEKVDEIMREDTREAVNGVNTPTNDSGAPVDEDLITGLGIDEPPLEHLAAPHKHSLSSAASSQLLPPVLPVGIEIFVAEPIVDRKSSFIGRACRISSPSDVRLVLLLIAFVIRHPV